MTEQAAQSTKPLAESTGNMGGKYLTFELGDTSYGMQVVKVREIIGQMAITRVPRTREFVLGVMNLRGKIIAVLDLRRMLELPPPKEEIENRIVVVEVGDFEVGLVVDRMREVLDIAEEDIDDRPSTGEGVEAQVVLGIGKPGGNVTVLLDIDRLLDSRDLDLFRTTTGK